MYFLRVAWRTGHYAARAPQYATGQPLSSIMERMACTSCRDGIRNLDPAAIIAARATP